MAKRDEALARAAVAAAYLRGLQDDVAQFVDMMIDPSDDEDGVEREGCLENMEIGLHGALVAVQAAAAAFGEMSLAARKEHEPDDDDGDDDGGDDEDDDSED